MPRDGDLGGIAPDDVIDANFTPQARDSLRLGAVKNVGHNANPVDCGGPQEARELSGHLRISAEGVDLRLLNKRVLESLIKSGAMDSMGRARRSMACDPWGDRASQKAQRDAESGQHGSNSTRLQPMHEQLPQRLLTRMNTSACPQKKKSGIFTGHPLEKYCYKPGGLERAGRLGNLRHETLDRQGRNHHHLALIGNLRVLKSKKESFYAQATLEDMSGSIDMIASGGVPALAGELEVPVLVKAGCGWKRVRIRRSRPRRSCRWRTRSIFRAGRCASGIPADGCNETTVDVFACAVYRTQRRGAGVDVESGAGDFMVVMEAEGYNVQPDRNFIARVEELCGRGSVRIIN